MPETLHRTKLYVPALRPNLVPRLFERLNQGRLAGSGVSVDVDGGTSVLSA